MHLTHLTLLPVLHKTLFFLLALSLLVSPSLAHLVKNKTTRTFYDDAGTNTGNQLNFKEGLWYTFADPNSREGVTGIAPDGRILEFHAPYTGFLNIYGTYHYNTVMKQAYLQTPKRVLIFYANKKPTIGPSIAVVSDSLYSTQQSADLVAVSDHITALSEKSEYSQIMENLNQLPFVKVEDMEASKANCLVNFPEILKAAADNGDDVLTAYTVNNINKDGQFNLLVVKLLLEHVVHGNKSALTTTTAVNAIMKKPNHDLLIGVMNLAKNDTAVLKILDDVFQSLLYFSQKLARDFYFIRSERFLNILFENHETNQFGFNALFLENITKKSDENIMRAKYIDELSLEPHDFELEYFKKFIARYPEKKDMFILVKLKELFMNLKKLYKALLPFMIKVNSNGNFPEEAIININSENAESLLTLFKYKFFGQLNSIFLTRVSKAMLALNVLPQLNITNLDSANDMMILKKNLMLAGQMSWGQQHNEDYLYFDEYSVSNLFSSP